MNKVTPNLDSRKYRLIQEIMRLAREEDLSKMEEQIKSIHREEDARFMEAVRPIRASVSLEALIAEQNYQPISAEAFFAKTKELEIEELLEELLAQLD